MLEYRTRGGSASPPDKQGQTETGSGPLLSAFALGPLSVNKRVELVSSRFFTMCLTLVVLLVANQGRASALSPEPFSILSSRALG